MSWVLTPLPPWDEGGLSSEVVAYIALYAPGALCLLLCYGAFRRTKRRRLVIAYSILLVPVAFAGALLTALIWINENWFGIRGAAP
jgi:hypothetical protein